ncbi:NAD(P)H-flavin reductase [Thalassotalea ponticola]|uniref:NAD(P)H-flavin reductase n=1 Tax=Thalassotalea ponticola TaxID=1523392 RepID=UPI0025B456B8|nr:NAD(P)H-flavin reductase [Thalassotalea ponticola]MDN3652977.1 NAD(P)H-flavin reductase [Thalassotalea ponticola]
MNRIRCQVASVKPLTETVFQVLLKPETAVSYVAGQYLSVVMGEDDKRPFSIASKPSDELIELQIGAFAADSWAMQVIDRVKQNDSIEVELPGGVAHLQEHSERPIILLAGGTGFSYIKSILAELAERHYTKPVLVYWGLRDAGACYQLEQTQALVDQLPQGQFNVVVENADSDWQGRVGRVHEPLLSDVVSLEPYDIYMAGRFDMVGYLRDEFIKHGALTEHMYADAFAFI